MSQFPRSSMSINSMLGTAANDQQAKAQSGEMRPSSVPAQQAVSIPGSLRQSPNMPSFRASSQPPVQPIHDPSRFFQHPGHAQHARLHETMYNHQQHLPQQHMPQQHHHFPPHHAQPHTIDQRMHSGMPHGSTLQHPQPGHFQHQQSMVHHDYRPPLLVDRDRERDLREREKERDRERDVEQEREREQRVIREREDQRMRELQQRERAKLESQQQRIRQQQTQQLSQPVRAQHNAQSSHSKPQQGRHKEPTARQRNRTQSTQNGESSKRSDRSPPFAAQKATRNDYKATSVRSNSPVVPSSQSSNRRLLLLNALNNLTTDFSKQKDQYFSHQLRQLQEDLSRLHNGTHLQFNAEITDLQDIRNEALFVAREEGLGRVTGADQDYDLEIALANEEYETTRTTLREELLVHLQNKKRRLESDQSLTDISLQTTLHVSHGDAPPSPSLSGAPRKLRHRIPAPIVGSRYPSTSLVTKTALDGVLESIGETVRARKGMGGVGAEDRVRDRIEREREKLVRTMLEGCRPNEADDDMALLRRKYVPKKNGIGISTTATGLVAGGAKRKGAP